MDKAPEKLEVVEPVALSHDKTWNCTDEIKEEGASEWAQVMIRDCGEFSECSCLFYKTKQDLDNVDDIYDSLDGNHRLLAII